MTLGLGADVTGHRIFYRHGKKRVYVEPLHDTLAVRCREGAEKAVGEALSSLGEVEPHASHRLLIVKFQDQSQREKAMKQLWAWAKEGEVEFFTPVLRDPESQLRQILTDEITVRFKPVVPYHTIERLMRRFGVQIARANEFVPNQFVVRTANANELRTLDLARQLHGAKEVDFAAPNFISEFRR